MRRTVSVHEAKTNLSRLLRDVEAGEEVVIRRGPEPVAVLRRYAPARTPGRLKGKIRIANDFDTLPPEVAEAFGAGD